MNLADARKLQPASTKPLRFESLIVGFRSDAGAIAALLPAPLVPDGTAAASLQFSATRAACGGFDVDARLIIDAELHGRPVAFVARRWAADADDAAALDAGFSVGRSRLIELPDRLNAQLEFGGRPIAIAAVSRRQPFGKAAMPRSVAAAWLARPQVSLRRGRAAAVLIERRFNDIEVREALAGTGELELPPGLLPLEGVLGALHVVADLLPVGRRTLDDEQQREQRVMTNDLTEEICA